MISPRHLEGVAREVHEQTNAPTPIDALALATACGLELRPVGGSRAEVDVEAGVIRCPLRVRDVRLHGLIAHELGHWLLWRSLLDHHDERAAQYLAGALMLPRAVFARDLGAFDWDLDALREQHVHASAQMIVVRMTQVSPATASVWDAGKLHRVYGAHDIAAARPLVDRVLTTERPERDGGLRAWPAFDGSWRRVLVLAA